MANRRKPTKPTTPYGHIRFGKDGSVSAEMSKLSGKKESQESEVAESFASRFPNDQSSVEVDSIRDLPEADQDFELITNQGNISIQLTEIVERQYTQEVSWNEYNSGNYHEFIHRGEMAVPLAVDPVRRDNVIAAAIRKKHQKYYAKREDESLWLLIFSTSAYLTTIYWESGERRISQAYQNAVAYSQSAGNPIFDEIWFYNLQTRPVRVSPPEEYDAANKLVLAMRD